MRRSFAITLLSIAAVAGCSAVLGDYQTGLAEARAGASGTAGASGAGAGGSTAGSGGTAGAGGTTAGSGGAKAGAGGAGGATAGAAGAGGQPADPCANTNKPRVPFSGEITANFTLTCDRDWLLQGEVVVTPGVTLTIEAGTRVLGEVNATNPAVLVVQPSAKLFAVGTAQKPIVFTSAAPAGFQKPGDWGGLILLGNAPTNFREVDGVTPKKGTIEGVLSGGTFGGDDPNDSSGTLRYLRLEYNGIAIAPNNEINGLTFGGVGRNTVVDHILVRETADDCFEWFGGTVNAKYLVCEHPGDDAFDWDNGYQGKLQFLVTQGDPKSAEESNGLEGDNDANASLFEPRSNPTLFNLTLCGKNLEVDKQQYGMLLRRNTKATIGNALVLGFEAGLDVRNTSTEIAVRNSLFFGNLVANLAYVETAGQTGVFEDDDGGLDELALLADPSAMISTVDPMLVAPFDPKKPDFRPIKSLTDNAGTPPNDGFFDASAVYLGAFRDANDDWMTGPWASWE